MGVATAKVIDYLEPFHSAMKLQHWNSSAWITDRVPGRTQTYDRVCRVAQSSIEANNLPTELPVALAAGKSQGLTYYSFG